MLIITGNLLVKLGEMSRVMEVSLKHVAQSRTEPGCISHGVYQDPENPLSLFFYEQWADQAAVDAHFALPSSHAFIKQIRPLVSTLGHLDIYTAKKIN